MERAVCRCCIMHLPKNTDLDRDIAVIVTTVDQTGFRGYPTHKAGTEGAFSLLHIDKNR